MLLARHFAKQTVSVGRRSFSSSLSSGFHFELSDDQKSIKDMVRRFAREEVAPKAAHYDKTGEYPWDILKKAHELGITNLHLPESVGGGGHGLFDTCKCPVNDFSYLLFLTIFD